MTALGISGQNMFCGNITIFDHACGSNYVRGDFSEHNI